MKLLLRRATFILGGVLLSGCGTAPIYDWRFDPTLDAHPPALGMDQAIGHLSKARAGYHKAIRLQIEEEARGNNAVILGTSALLTAAGLNAHSDVLKVGGILTGTTFTMTKNLLPRTRASVYLAGIGALNCAEAAVAPLRISDLAQFKQGVAELQIAEDNLRTAIAVAEKRAAAGAELSELLDVARKMQSNATAVISAARSYLAKADRAAALLYVQVEQVDKGVVEGGVESTPDPDKVKAAAAGIGGLANSIITAAVSDSAAIKSAATGIVTQSLRDKALVQEGFTDLSAATRAVIAAIAKVSGSLPTGYEALGTDTIKACNLKPAKAVLSAAPSELHFTIGDSGKRVVVLQGGTPEYIAAADGLPAGVTVKQPGRGGNALEVLFDGAAVAKAGRFDIHVRDQVAEGSAPSAGVLVSLHIAPSPAQPPAAFAAQDSVAQVATRLMTAKGTDGSGKSYQVVTARPGMDGKSIEVSVCGKLDASRRSAIETHIAKVNLVPESMRVVVKDIGC